MPIRIPYSKQKSIAILLSIIIIVIIAYVIMGIYG